MTHPSEEAIQEIRAHLQLPPSLQVVTDSIRSGSPDAETGETWRPKNLDDALRGTRPPGPTLLSRSDGVCLVYPGKINGLTAAPESAKGMLAIKAAVQEIRKGNDVLYIDHEDDAPEIVQRFLDYGLTAEEIRRHFVYVRPDEPLRDGDVQFLVSLIVERKITLVINDGVNEAMERSDFDYESNRDVVRWYNAFVRPLAQTGAGILNLDHVTKSKESRGRYAIGGQAKLAGIDGAAYGMEVTDPLGRGRTGRVKIVVQKDRPGHVRRYAQGGKVIGEFVVTSDNDGSNLHAELLAPSGGRVDENGLSQWRPTHLMERVSKYVESHRDGPTQSDVLRVVTGGRDTLRTALQFLVEDGYVEVVEIGRAHRHRSIRPYRDLELLGDEGGE